MQRGRLGRSISSVFGLLSLARLAYIVSEIVRRDHQLWPLIDSWGVAGFEILVSGLCLLRALVSRRGRGVALTLGMGLLARSIGDLRASGLGSSHVGTLFNAAAWSTSILLVAAAVWLRPTRS